ncbi:NAD(P)-dependent oxidoreductase [Paractinoplanes ferrugineus]|uniref:6-phosphogluconate dehydrogenase n=1 Tax=Paractinoplanes ferrugineus TaxID=113564 RepID=A0A919J6U1_9ACTN|nr:NAD(P)-dependent oxidoreductase [Actinoplanes ferrugineus]GIE15128.1 6-phosphogluconate dehydrogenase [Actinoplanes ferrugineus]
MPIVGILSPGQMGAGLGAALRTNGARVVTTVAGRSPRTAGLAAEAALEVLPTVADVLSTADVVLSVTPPGAAREAARRIRETTRGGQIIADLNAVSPETMTAIAQDLPGLRVVDGAISGPPPHRVGGTFLYLAGADAGEVAGLPWGDTVVPVVVGDRIGAASAVKMCTGSVYKGLTALVAQAIRVAGAHGVLSPVLLDLERNDLARTAAVATSAPKAHRFVAEMLEVAATQEAAGLTPHLFTAIAEVYAEIAGTRLAEGFPETATDLAPDDIVARLDVRR